MLIFNGKSHCCSLFYFTLLSAKNIEQAKLFFDAQIRIFSDIVAEIFVWIH